MGNKGTTQGNNEEIELVQKLNSNKNSELWKIINHNSNNDSYYAVRCTTKKLSLVSNQKVFPKSDVFIIKSSNIIVLDKYYLDENMLKNQNIEYTLIMDSGISVKEKKSKSYTIQKMTIETFYKLFGNYELGCAIEYYTTEEDFKKNLILEVAWHTNKRKIIDKINKLKDKYNYTHNLPLNNNKNIKRSAIELTHYIIDNDAKISDFIFKGIGAFSNPFYALYIYKEEKMFINNIPIKYSITTGSGRSKGDYTVVIKP